MPQSTNPAHAVLAVVLQVRDGRLQVLLWQRAREPYAGRWALPGGRLDPDETLEESIRRHLAEKVDVRELAHLEQLETRSEPARNPAERELATALPRPRPHRRRPRGARRHALAPGHAPAGARLRPRRDHLRRPRAPAGEALLHERRLRARAGDVHDLGAARDLPRRARPRRLGDEPPARAPAPAGDRADRRAPLPGARGRPAGGGLPLPVARRSRSPTSSRCCDRRADPLARFHAGGLRRTPTRVDGRRSVRRRHAALPADALDRRQPSAQRPPSRPDEQHRPGLGEVRRLAAAGDRRQPAPALRARPAVVAAVPRLR